MPEFLQHRGDWHQAASEGGHCSPHFAGRAKYSIFEAASTTWPHNTRTLSEVLRQDGSPELARSRRWSSFDRAVSSESLDFAATVASMGFQLQLIVIVGLAVLDERV